MATSFRRRQEGVPKFFKIILHPESDSLRIPNEFARRHGPDLRKRVSLKVPEGSAMEVEFIQSSTSNGEALFKKGWLEFKERYSIGFGYLLFFIYNGNSQFDVLIFDPTATEISYPVERRQSADSDDDDSVVILENFEVSRNNPLAKKQRKCSDNNMAEFPSSKSIPDRSGKLVDESSTSGYLTKTKAVAKETCIAYQKALAYKSNTSPQKPFFISLIQPSYVSDYFNLSVNASFAKACLMLIGNNNLCLSMNGRKWDVICCVQRGFGKANLTRGWKKFAQDNGLKVGDACIFEASAELVWDVMIFRS